MKLSFKEKNDNIKKIEKFKEMMSLPEGKRRTMLRSMGRGVRRTARTNMKNQKNIDGSAYESRKEKSNKKGMFKRLGRGLIVPTETDSVRVAWASPDVGKVARAHHEGLQETFTAVKAVKQYGRPHYGDPATKKQIKALLAEGFKVKRKTGKKGKTKWVTPTQKWIKENIFLGQAGLILKAMRNETPKKQWSINLAKRTLLGATQEEVYELAEQILSKYKERD
ncbi:phage virion morphogenesis protein [Pseudomonas sp. HK3]